VKEMRFAVIGMLALSGMVWAAPELNESYTSLKDAVEKKDIPKVKTLAAQTSKEARELEKEAQPAEASGMEAWKGRQQFAKDADTYSEYALAISAIQATDPAVTIDLVDTLIAQDPKSEQIDGAAPYYLAALGKQGTPKMIAGANKIVAGRPDNEDALYAIASNSLSSNPGAALTAANKLVAAVGRNKKPEGTSDADWDKKKNAMLGAGYTFAGVVHGSQNRYADADRSLKAALPLIGGQPAMLSYAYYYLGLSNYQLGKLTADKSKMTAGIQYADKAAAMAGPMQTLAARDSATMKRDMATPVRR
jgi:hypothetical protein